MDVLEQLKKRYKVKETADPNEIRLNCPNCNDTKFHLYCSLKKHVCFCQRCNKIYSLFTLISNKQINNNFKKCLKTSNKVLVEKVSLPPNAVDASKNKGALNYLINRGLTKRDIDEYEIGFCNEGRYAHRLIFPIKINNRVTGFVARTIIDDKPKYLYPNSMKKSNQLFNIGYDTADFYVLVEGIFDAIRVGKRGIAILGSYLSQGQLDLLLGYLPKSSTIVVMLDSDAKIKALKVASKLSSYFNVKIAFLKDGDPGSKTREELNGIIKSAKPYSINSYKEVL